MNYLDLNPDRIKLVEDADISYPTAEEIYEGIGVAVRTDRGDLDVQTVSSEELVNYSEGEIRGELLMDSPDISEEDADNLVGLALDVYEDCESLQKDFEAILDAYDAGDSKLVLDRLMEAGSHERKHGDDSFTRDLAGRLLKEPTSTPDDAYNLRELGTVAIEDEDEETSWVAYEEPNMRYIHVVSEEDWLNDNWVVDEEESIDHYIDDFCFYGNFADDETAYRVGQALDLDVVHSIEDSFCGLISCGK